MNDTEKPESTAMRVPALEWPTLALVIGCYAAWIALTSRYEHWPAWIVVPAIAVLLTFHSSLQHELLHGHPTRSPAFNRLLGLPPLSLWIPYDRYRVTHLIHHRDARLTDPLDDPETNYWTPQAWEALPAVQRLVARIDATLLGRMLVGVWWRIGRFLAAEARAFARNEPGIRAAWITHGLLCIPVLAWVTLACGIPAWLYVVAMVVPGNAILLVRSYAEHRAHDAVSERTAIVEDAWILGPLFLFNNLHALHHEQPGLPWYRYGARYRTERARLLAGNGGLVYRGYLDIARRYLLRPHDQLPHPRGRAPLAQAG
jgi:fatty acid desaturase